MWIKYQEHFEKRKALNASNIIPPESYISFPMNTWPHNNINTKEYPDIVVCGSPSAKP